MFLTTQGGILGPFAWIFGKILNVIYMTLADENGIANLAWCIILFTVIVKILMLPFTFRQQKSAKINAYIQPEISKVQKKYKDKKDQDSMMKMNTETQAIYKKYGTSMAGGCGTALVQFPIILALYRVIQNIPAYVESVYNMYKPIAEKMVGMQNVVVLLKDFVDENKITNARVAIKNLESVVQASTANIIDVIDKFAISQFQQFKELGEVASNPELVNAINQNIPNIEKMHSFLFGINISEAPGFQLTPALLIPILSALFQYLSTKTMRMPQADDANPMSGNMMKSLNVSMPVMSFFICVSFPAGIGLYWAVSAFLTLVTQVCVNFYYDHTDMEKIIAKNIEKAKNKAEKKGDKKSFMERMMEQSGMAQAGPEQNESINKMANAGLKNYTTSEEVKKNQKASDYKEGSIGSKANIMLKYKEDK